MGGAGGPSLGPVDSPPLGTPAREQQTGRMLAGGFCSDRRGTEPSSTVRLLNLPPTPHRWDASSKRSLTLLGHLGSRHGVASLVPRLRGSLHTSSVALGSWRESGCLRRREESSPVATPPRSNPSGCLGLVFSRCSMNAMDCPQQLLPPGLKTQVGSLEMPRQLPPLLDTGPFQVLPPGFPRRLHLASRPPRGPFSTPASQGEW